MPTTTRSAGTERREKAAAAAKAAKAAERRRRVRNQVVVGTGIAVAVAGIVAIGALTGKDRGAVVDHRKHADTAHTAGAALPPWPNAADPSAAIRAAGLTPAASEGTADHYHAHLDVIVNGKKTPVAASIGADERRRVISPLHTHDGTGVIHVEAPTVGDAFYLGQLFAEWNVGLSEHMLGGLHADENNTLTAYIDGKRTAGDPAKIRLAAHQEIALVYGPKNQQVNIPSSYDFGAL